MTKCKLCDKEFNDTSTENGESYLLDEICSDCIGVLIEELVEFSYVKSNDNFEDNSVNMEDLVEEGYKGFNI